MNRRERRRQKHLRKLEATGRRGRRSPGSMNQAVREYQSGNLGAAGAVCRNLLLRRPRDADAMHLLGLIKASQGEHDVAEGLLENVLSLISPNPALLHNLGKVKANLGKLDEAERAYLNALEIEPSFLPALNSLGILLQGQGRVDEAIEAYERSLVIDPNWVDALSNLGSALVEQGRNGEATKVLCRAVALDPNHAQAHTNLGNAFEKAGASEKAMAEYERALFLNPRHAEAAFNLGNVLADVGRTEEAIEAFQTALRLKPSFIDVLNNLGNVLKDAGRPVEALSAYDRVLQVNGQDAKAHWNKALALLVLGRLREGWGEYEWRWLTSDFSSPRRNFAQPLWNGSELGGQTILLHAEQGLGDTVQFIRYVSLVKQRGGRVVVECQAPLKRLLAGIAEIDVLITRGEPLPAFDLHAPLLSLPGIFETDLESIPVSKRYLEAPRDLSIHLRDATEPKVGIVWSGSTQHTNDRNRSVPLDRFQEILCVPSCRFFSLQVDLREGDDVLLRRLPQIVDLRRSLSDFASTATVMDQLDLMITVDTAVAHLAGAMGKPVWTLLPFAPDWRWLLERTDTPWYPSMRLFRQSRAGDWGSVLSSVDAALAEFARSFGKQRSALPLPSRVSTTDSADLRGTELRRSGVSVGVG